MKKNILLIIAGVFLTLAVSSFWAFKNITDEPGNYVAVDFENIGQDAVTFSYNDGTSEVVKYGSYFNPTDIIIKITNKLEAKGYTLFTTNCSVDSKNPSVYNC